MSILVSDYDGTFDRKKSDIKINCQSIASFIKEGNIFVLSSGRSYNSLLSEVYNHNIPYNFLATCDGSYLYDSNGTLLFSHSMNHDVISKAIALCEKSKCKRIDFAYTKDYSSYYIADENIGCLALVIDEKDITSDFFHQFYQLKENNPFYDYSYYGYNGLFYFMVKCKGLSKSSPINFLRNKLSISTNEIYTIGDNLNDLEMINDFNGFVISDNEMLQKVSLGRYDSVHDLTKDILNRKVKRR